jgi:hypothetical protein
MFVTTIKNTIEEASKLEVQFQVIKITIKLLAKLGMTQISRTSYM